MNVYRKNDLQSRRVILYGAGNLGKKLYRCLNGQDIPIAGVIDKNAEQRKIENLPIWKPDADELVSYMPGSIVVLSGLFGRTEEEKIRNNLIKIGCEHICALREIDWSTIKDGDFLKNLFIGDFSDGQLKQAETKGELAAALQLFHDDEQRFMRTYVEAHSKKNYALFPLPLPLEEQYLAADTDMELDARVFVDAGAYDGDVLRRFWEKGRNVDRYIAFEPQGDLCQKIKETLENGRHGCEGLIFPCGLSDCWEELKFSANIDGTSAAKVDVGGTSSIQCLPLDEALMGIGPTFIKMDIEGMELKALYGTANIIRTYRPQLAICVYHELAHLWKIPLYLHSLCPDYKFAIRNYQYMGLETVVYAYL